MKQSIYLYICEITRLSEYSGSLNYVYEALYMIVGSFFHIFSARIAQELRAVAL